MPPIVITISIEGDPDGSIEALRRIAGNPDSWRAVHAGLYAPPVSGIEEEPEESDYASGMESAIPVHPVPNYRQVWQNYAGTVANSQLSAEPVWPAHWDARLGNELVRNMSESARRLVGVLATAGADGMTRGNLTAELGIENDAIRTTQVSIGHALRRVQKANGNISLPRPVEFHKRIDTYILNPGFRAAIQDNG